MPETPEPIGTGRHLSLVRRGGWEYARRNGTGGVVAVIAVTPEDELVLVEQRRIPLGGPVIELPAGLVGDERDHLGEATRDAAARELLEETGFGSDRWSEASVELASSAGLTDESVRVFAAIDVERRGPGGGVGDESITVHLVPIARLAAWLQARAADGVPADGRVWAAPLLLTVLGGGGRSD